MSSVPAGTIEVGCPLFETEVDTAESMWELLTIHAFCNSVDDLKWQNATFLSKPPDHKLKKSSALCEVPCVLEGGHGGCTGQPTNARKTVRAGTSTKGAGT